MRYFTWLTMCIGFLLLYIILGHIDNKNTKRHKELMTAQQTIIQIMTTVPLDLTQSTGTKITKPETVKLIKPKVQK